MNSKPTPGPWTLDRQRLEFYGIGSSIGMIVAPDITGGNDGADWVIAIPMDGLERDAYTASAKDECLANAALIAEAGTVYHETGLTPRELVRQHASMMNHACDLRRQRDELLEACEAFVEFAKLGDTVTRGQYIKYQVKAIGGAQAAIANARKEGVAIRPADGHDHMLIGDDFDGKWIAHYQRAEGDRQ